MALNKESDEQDQQWHAHFLQERHDLSSSVEATLDDGSSQEAQWSDEEDGYIYALQEQKLIAPRLSLQSKVVLAVQPGSFVRSAMMSHRIVGAEEMQKITPTEQVMDMLISLAQHLGSSFASFCSSTQLAMFLPLPLSDNAAGWSSCQASSLLSTVVETEPTPTNKQTNTTTVVEAVESPLVQSKQKLAGHTAKVRLQTLTLPTVSPTSSDVEERKAATTSTHLAAVEELHRAIGGGVFSGSGVFESKQCEVMIADSHVTASSVVLVTLTANPGPVVVQHISLHARIGFTVHLTAPTAEKTPFNYIILLGE